MATMLSPCNGICALNAKDFCSGCFRTADEIGAWVTMSGADRTHLMDVVLPEREAHAAQTAS